MCLILNLACGFLNRSDKNSSNLSANNANSNTKSNSNQKSEEVSTPIALKPPEPCGWLEKSTGLKLKTKEYKEHSYEPGTYDCHQGIALVNDSSFGYNLAGDATTIKQLYVGIKIGPKNTAKQKELLQSVLWDAANQVAEKAGGQKLTDEMLMAIITNEKGKEFTLAAGEDPTKPQLKSVFIDSHPQGTGTYTIVKMKF